MATNRFFDQVKDYIAHNAYELLNSFILKSSGIGRNNSDKEVKVGEVKVGGYAGIFGQKDERVVQILLDKMEKMEAGDSQKMANFLGWLFPKTNDRLSNIVIWYKRNEFTTFVTKMGSIEGQKTGETKKVTIDNNVTTTETEEIRADSVDNGLNLFCHLLSIIKSEKEEIKGFQKCRSYMVNSQIPCIEEGWIEKSGALSEKFKRSYPELLKKAKDSTGKIADKLETSLKERKKRKSIWQKFCEKCL